VGICGNVYAKQIRKVLAVYDLDILGKTEATWVMEAENMGPFIVDMDTKGRHYFSEVRAMTSGKLREQYRLLGIPGDYDYTMTEL
jgi:tartrate dehydratase beta subunit/fumarate hydratase class I family protein